MKYAIEIDPYELSVRMAESFSGIRRPCPDAKEAFDAMDERVRNAWLEVARVAAEYVAEAINAASTQTVQ